MKSDLQNRVLSALKARKMAVNELAFELGQPEETLKPAILAMQTEGWLSEEGGLLSVTEKGDTEVQEPEGFVILPMTAGSKPAQDDGGSKPANGNGGSKPAEDDGGNSDADLSEQEWLVIKLLLSNRGQPFDLSEVARTLGDLPARAAIDRLTKLGIVEKHHQGYRITAQSALNIPLSADEKKELTKLEAQISSLVEDIEGKKFLVAAGLRIIRNKRLYRSPTCKRFGDYVAARFERTRDWAYKMIQHLDVLDRLQQTKNKNVEALLQSVTTREVPHLAKLKKEPAKMQKALLLAEEEAKAAGRPRTTDDVMNAVEAVQNEGKKKDQDAAEAAAEAAPKKVHTVTIKGLDYDDAETGDLPGYFLAFAKWLEKHPTDDAFTIKVSKAKAAA